MIEKMKEMLAGGDKEILEEALVDIIEERPEGEGLETHEAPDDMVVEEE